MPSIHSNSSTTSFSTASATQSSSSSNNNNNNNYRSPYTSYFNRIQNNQSSLFPASKNTSDPPAPSPSSSPSLSPPLLKCGISESVLSFKTTTYDRLMLPPYVQPSEYKVTLKVYTRDLPLDTSKLEYQIFQQIVGQRYNTERQELKLTSAQFASRIENKRHLCMMLDRIVLGAKRLAKEVEEGKDMGLTTSSTSTTTTSSS